jgi:hypothetical protein
MPISKVGLVRTDGSTNSASGGPYIPLYSVLFYYGNNSDFANTSSGTLGIDYYRSYVEIFDPIATYYRADGSSTIYKGNPIISCIGQDANWDTQTGVCTAASTNLPNTGATLFDTFTHNPSTMVRTNVYNVLGALASDQTSLINTYIPQTGAYSHNHSANNIAEVLRGIQFGKVNGTSGLYDGINAIAVQPILRDPRLSTNLNEVYTEKKLYFLPKNVIVFGNSLPTNNYTRGDTFHSKSATNLVLPLIAKADNVGVLNIANTLSFYLSTNTVLNHNHNVFPLVTKHTSKKTGQTGYQLTDAGLHSHQLTYTSNVAIRSKILKAWVTNKDVTPLANGIIIGYSIGKNTLYQGTYSNSASLPINWHFCDGNKGTPDLRGYFIYANFDPANNSHDAVYNSSNTLTIQNITVAANGNHSHLGPQTGSIVGTGTPIDIGSHSYETYLNHTHNTVNATSFLQSPTDIANTTNILVGQSYTYTPPQVQLAFIMYNNTIA